ncbi:MAG: tetratricopeptide repeat protein [bacterium]
MKTLKYIIQIMVIILPLNNVFGSDNIDQLTLQLYESEGKEKVNILNQLSKAYRDNDNNKVYHYSKRALQVAKSINYKKGKADAMMNIGIFYASTGNYEQSELNFQNALDIYQEYDDASGIAHAYLALGRLSGFTGDYKNAIVYNNLALNIAKKLNDEKLCSSIHLNLGIIYDDIQDMKNALKHYLKALSLKKKQKDDKIGIAKAYNNIGQLYFNNNLHEKSLEYYLTALKILGNNENTKLLSNLYNNISLVYLEKELYDSSFYYQEMSLKLGHDLNDKLEVLISYLNLGNLEMIVGNYKKAEEYFKNSKTLSEQISDENVLADAYQHLGKLNLKKGNYKNALKFLFIAQEFNTKSKNITAINENYNLTSEIYYKMGNNEKSLAFLKLSNSLKDSINDVNSKTSLESLSMKYQAEIIIDNLKKQESLHKAETSKLYLIIGFSCLILFILIISGIIIIRKNKLLNNKILELETMNDFQNGVYFALTKSVKPNLFPLSVTIAKLNHLKEYEDLSKSYTGIANELDKIVKSYKDFNNN